MAKVEITVECKYDRLLAAMTAQTELWTEDQRTAFADQWHRLEEAGAEMVETRFIGDRLVAWPSEDFTAHCAKWGIHP